jgi:hypothetical protein
MTEFLLGFGFGFVMGSLVFGMAWQGARRRVQELEALLKMTVGELVEKRRK